MTTRQIIALGGSASTTELEDPALDRYILQQTGKDRPKVAYLGTTSGDASQWILAFYQTFSALDARPSHLSLFALHTADLEGYLLDQDAIYVGGGNTRSMLALWREWRLDAILKQAYERGIVLAGVSAGANCWFEECSTDSTPGQLSILGCLGFLPGSFCPHYDSEAERRPWMQRMVAEGRIRPGLAADDGAAAHFVDGELARAVGSRPNARVYRLRRAKRTAVEEPLTTAYLGEAED